MDGRNAEDLLQASLLGDAVDAAPIAVYVGDDDFRYLAVNRAACELLGYTRDELIRLRLGDVVTSSDDRLREAYRRCQQKRTPPGGTGVRREGGGTRPGGYTAVAARRGRGGGFLSFAGPPGAKR